MNDHIKRILDSIEKVSPEAWRNLVEYAVASAATEIFISLIFLSASLGALNRAVIEYEKATHYERDNPLIIGIISSIVAVVCFIRLSLSIPIVISPDGYVVNLMIQSVSK